MFIPNIHYCQIIHVICVLQQLMCVQADARGMQAEHNMDQLA